MRQSTIIFGTLLLAFVIYITLRGQLPAYLSLFTGGPSGGSVAPSKVNASGGATTPNVKSIGEILSNLGLS